MKKILALILVLVMVFSLVACGASEEPAADTAAEPAATDTTPAAEPADSGNALGGDVEEIDNSFTGEIGMFDPDYDYSANPTYKVCYYIVATGVLYEAFSDAFAHWAGLMNLQYDGLKDAGGDKDAYLSNLETLAKQYDGLLLDADATQYARVNEILGELGTPWQNCMADARDYEQSNTPLLHPYFGFDNEQVGAMMLPELVKFKEELWPDVDQSEFGYICVDFTVSPPLHARCQGFYNAVKELDPDATSGADLVEDGPRFFVADTSIATFDVDTSNQVVSAVLAQHSDIEYWLVFAEIDDMAQGSAAAMDTAGLTDTAAIVTFGGTGLQQQWDNGLEDAWRAACYLPQTIYAEPIICALYAYMNGDATPETIWSDWIDANDPGYAKRLLPAYWIEHDNYKSIIRWSDIYAQSDLYPEYSSEGLTRDSYSTKVQVPESYKG